MFNKRQIQILRRELLNTHEVAKRSDPMWNWQNTKDHIEEYFQAITDDIREEWPEALRCIEEVDLGRSNNFSRFATGKVTETSQDKLLAIYLWLISDSNIWSSLVKEDLFPAPMITKVANYLCKFLYNNTDENPRIDSEYLIGQYQFENAKRSLILTVYEQTDLHVCPAELKEIRRKTGESGDNVKKMSVRYTGWIVVAPNDALICMFQNQTEKCNHIFLPIGINEIELNFDNSIINLLFQDVSIINEFSTMELQNDLKQALQQWLARNMHNVVNFEKIQA